MTHLMTAKRETPETMRPFVIEPATAPARPGVGSLLPARRQPEGQSQDHFNLIPAPIVFPLASPP